MRWQGFVFRECNLRAHKHRFISQNAAGFGFASAASSEEIVYPRVGAVEVVYEGFSEHPVVILDLRIRNRNTVDSDTVLLQHTRMTMSTSLTSSPRGGNCTLLLTVRVTAKHMHTDTAMKKIIIWADSRTNFTKCSNQCT